MTTNKLLTSLSAGLLSSSLLSAQTLFTYGNKPVSQTEFIRAFEKNPDSGNRKKAMVEYLPLYINYKLKVQDAIDKKMDTLPNQRVELQNYRSQLEESFINEKSNADNLVKEAFERSQKDILLGHLFIGFDHADTTSIANAAFAAASAAAALKAKQDFATVVSKYSTDEYSKANGGLSGWITVFSIPYNYENAVYNEPVGGTTAVIKGTTGFHIFKKIAERPAEGRVRVAQIMLVNTDKTNPDSDQKLKLLADSLHQALQAGASFDELAKKFSNDRTSYAAGGALPEFGVGAFDANFEKQAFALQTKGDISQPFQTGYGLHILKLLDKMPVSKNIADVDGLLRQKVLSGNRTETAKASYIKSQIPKMGYKPGNIAPQLLWQYTDSSIKGGNTKNLKINSRTPLFSFGQQTTTATEWAQYAKSTKMAGGIKATKAYGELMEDFIQFSAEDYQRRNLDKVEPTFGMQLREFQDANLLFESMDKNVWTKASADSVGLKKYYDQHKANYKWGASATAVLVTASDAAIADTLFAAFKARPTEWRTITEKYTDGVIADSGRYELAQIPVTVGMQLVKGLITTPIKNEVDGSKTFAYIIDMQPANSQRSFDEARGFVINDYQQVLEERWLSTLKKKYPVKVNEVVWKKLQAE